MAQEAFMKWDQIQVSWKQLKRNSFCSGSGWLMTMARVWNWSARRCRGTTEATRNRPLSPRRPRKAERVFVAHWLLNCRAAAGNLLTSSHDPARRKVWFVPSGFVLKGQLNPRSLYRRDWDLDRVAYYSGRRLAQIDGRAPV